MKTVAVLALVLATVMLGGGACVYHALSDDGIPTVAASADFISPDGQFVATVELVHNGLGYGAGALYDEVHLNRVFKPVLKHGDPDPSVVFYAEPVPDAAGAPSVQWLGSTRLRIFLHPHCRPSRKLAFMGPVAIEYMERSS